MKTAYRHRVTDARLVLLVVGSHSDAPLADQLLGRQHQAGLRQVVSWIFRASCEHLIHIISIGRLEPQPTAPEWSSSFPTLVTRLPSSIWTWVPALTPCECEQFHFPVECINDRQNLCRYFGNMVKELVRIGYRRGESVFGAPYDFRKAPSKIQYSLRAFLLARLWQYHERSFHNLSVSNLK